MAKKWINELRQRNDPKSKNGRKRMVKQMLWRRTRDTKEREAHKSDWDLGVDPIR